MPRGGVRLPEVENPDGAECHASGAGSAKNWTYANKDGQRVWIAKNLTTTQKITEAKLLGELKARGIPVHEYNGETLPSIEQVQATYQTEQEQEQELETARTRAMSENVDLRATVTKLEAQLVEAQLKATAIETAKKEAEAEAAKKLEQMKLTMAIEKAKKEAEAEAAKKVAAALEVAANAQRETAVTKAQLTAEQDKGKLKVGKATAEAVNSANEIRLERV